MTSRNATVHAAALAEELASRGMLGDPRWRRALLEVPRDRFAPLVGWAVPDRGRGAPHRIDAVLDSAGWWQTVYSDASIVTQRDDGAGDPTAAAGVPTSSLSAPGVVVEFLELLEPREHDRTLEVGTGTGWTAALLSWRLGERNVTSVEVDEAVSGQAAANLTAAGYTPRLVVGDGADGWPGAAPYDRVHATCSVSRVPLAWISQTRPGGFIVTPWSSGFGNGHKLRLRVVDEQTASGSFHGRAGFMMLRAQRRALRWNPHGADHATSTTTRLDPRTIVDAEQGAHLAITALVPGIGSQAVSGPSGALSLLLFEADAPEASWAACDYEPGATDFQVTQQGDRRLWDETQAAYLQWITWGSPAAGRFGLTVHGDAEYLWLDTPEQRISPR